MASVNNYGKVVIASNGDDMSKGSRQQENLTQEERLQRRVDQLEKEVEAMSLFLQDLTCPEIKQGVGGGKMNPYLERKWYHVPKPPDVDRVYDAIRRSQEKSFRTQLPKWLRDLGTLTPTQNEINDHCYSIINNFKKNPDEYRELCVTRQNLLSLTNLQHQDERLRANTDHLVSVGGIIQFGDKPGMEYRFGIPLDGFDIFSSINHLFTGHPTSHYQGPDGVMIYNLEGLLS